MKNFKVEYITQWSFIVFIVFSLFTNWTNEQQEKVIPDIVQTIVRWILAIGLFGSIAFFIVQIIMGREFKPKK